MITCVVKCRYISLLTYAHGDDPLVLLINSLENLNVYCKKKRLNEYENAINKLRKALAVDRANLPRIGNEQVANYEVCDYLYVRTDQTNMNFNKFHWYSTLYT
jgi:hypothetical protein